MGNSTEYGDQCVIVVVDLFDKINKQRKLLNRAPVEHQAIAAAPRGRPELPCRTGQEMTGVPLYFAI